jgi:hypothetical protein
LEDFRLTKEEAIAILKVLKSNWIQPDDQRLIYNVVIRLEKQLGDEQ